MSTYHREFTNASPYQQRLFIDILLSQAIDHTIVLVSCAVFVLSSFSLFKNKLWAHLHTFGPTFWMGLTMLVVLMGISYRILMLLIEGQTLGQKIMRFRYQDAERLSQQITCSAIEALHLAFPMFWVIDMMTRKFFVALKPHYLFDYGKNK